METQQTVQLEDTPEDVLPLQWNSIVRESRAPKTPVVPLTPITPRTVRHMQSLSGSLRTIGLPMASPSAESIYSPVDSIADMSMKSKSAESLTYTFPSHLAPPPRSSSRAAFTGTLPKEDDVPLLESEGRDSIILFKEDIAAISRAVGPIIEEEPSLLDIEIEDDVLGAFPSPPAPSDSAVSSAQRNSQPNTTIINHLLPPLSPLRPSSSSSGTLGLTGDADSAKKQTGPKRLSKRISKRSSRRISILTEGHAEIQNWEADIDWTYDNNVMDEWVDDLEGIEEEEEITNGLWSQSAPVSASPSTVNLASLNIAAAQRYSDDSKTFLATPEDDTAPLPPPEIGVADGGFGLFDHADRQYNAIGHQRQLSKTRNGVNQRTLSTCASLPNLKASRKHYRNASLRGVSNLDNGIVTLDEIDELQHLKSPRTHSAAREVAIPPVRYSGRSRAASNATCTTLVSDIEGYPSDLSEMASTPSHSSHNSAEGPYFLPQTQDGVFLDTKGQLVAAHGVHILNDEVPFNFF
ncbi:hypothetical protein ABW20_dc0102742 [Dactylellina cionopaga]|nr:hypothetical protein ABW20_dc0102742 [Dactylellina cionopaga]